MRFAFRVILQEKVLTGLLGIFILSSCISTNTRLTYQEYGYNIRQFTKISKNRIIQTGFFKDSIQFDEQIRFEQGRKAYGDNYIAILKKQKIHCISTISSEEKVTPTTLLVDKKKNFYVSFLVSDEIQIDTNTVSLDFLLPQELKIIAKYSDECNLLWSKAIAGEIEPFISDNIFVDDFNNLLVSFRKVGNGQVYFNDELLITHEKYSNIVIKLSEAGEILWYKGANSEIKNLSIEGNIMLVDKRPTPDIVKKGENGTIWRYRSSNKYLTQLDTEEGSLGDEIYLEYFDYPIRVIDLKRGELILNAGDIHHLYQGERKFSNYQKEEEKLGLKRNGRSYWLGKIDEIGQLKWAAEVSNKYLAFSDEKFRLYKRQPNTILLIHSQQDRFQTEREIIELIAVNITNGKMKKEMIEIKGGGIINFYYEKNNLYIWGYRYNNNLLFNGKVLNMDDENRIFMLRLKI